MRSTLPALALAVLSIIVWSAPPAIAQDAKTARGTIAAMSGRSLTVKVGDHAMTFLIDSKTVVEAKGASTKSGRAAAAGKPAPRIDELLQTGQTVAVTYKDLAGDLHASAIKAVPKASVSNASGDGAMTSTGIVKVMGADWITINGHTGGGATFEQRFKIDPATKVFAKGGGTAAAANGGRAPFADLVAAGDHVSISYHKSGESLVASSVRVTMKGH